MVPGRVQKHVEKMLPAACPGGAVQTGRCCQPKNVAREPQRCDPLHLPLPGCWGCITTLKPNPFICLFCIFICKVKFKRKKIQLICSFFLTHVRRGSPGRHGPHPPFLMTPMDEVQIVQSSNLVLRMCRIIINVLLNSDRDDSYLYIFLLYKYNKKTNMQMLHANRDKPKQVVRNTKKKLSHR